MGFYRFKKREQLGILREKLDNVDNRSVERLTSYGGRPPRSIVLKVFPIFRVGKAAVHIGSCVREDTMVIENRKHNQGGRYNQGEYVYVSAVDDETEKQTVSTLESLTGNQIKLYKVSEKLVHHDRV